jgi:hypothetical protein
MAACTAGPAVAATRIHAATSSDCLDTISPESEDVVMRALDLRSGHEQSLNEDYDEDFVLYCTRTDETPTSTSNVVIEN